MEQYLLCLSPFTISSFLFLLISFSLIVLIFKTSSSRKTPKNAADSTNLPPGPWRLPILGNLHQLMGPDPAHRRLRDLAKEYGPVMQLQLGELPHVVVSSAEAARDVLKTHDAVLGSRPSLLAATILFYGRKGIVYTPYGDYWRFMRRICAAELLSNKHILSYRLIREEEFSGNLVRRISIHGTVVGVVNLPEILFWVTNRVIARSAFGVVRENTESLIAVVNSVSDMLGGLTVSDLYPSVKFLPTVTGYRAKLTRLHRAADVLLEDIIGEHVARRARKTKEVKGDSCDQEGTEENLVDVLLDIMENCTDVESRLTNDHIKAVTTELFLAGSGTSSVTLEWIMSELMRNPRVMKKAQEEIRCAFSGKGKVDEEGLDELKYMNAVIKESLRLHPNGPLLAPRETQQDVVVNGYLILAGTKVMVNAWAIGRDSSYWTDPEAFYPERFVDCSVDYKGMNFEFIPFGAGRRICAGMSFGMAMVKLGLASLLYHFDWKLPAGMKPEDVDMVERFGITLRRKNQLYLIPVEYSAKSDLPSDKSTCFG